MSRKPKAGAKNSLRTVIGVHACSELIAYRSDWVASVSIQEGRERELQALIDQLSRKNIKYQVKGRKFFANMGDGHQGVAISATDRLRWEDEWATEPKSLVVFLDGITDPHNLGAILRTSWLLGVRGIFIPKDRRVDLTPVVSKVACGGVEHVPVESCHFVSQLQWFKDQGYWVHGLSEAGTVSLPDQDVPDKSVLIIGAEDRGLRSSTQGACGQLISIPQAESGSSYNASVAFALCAYEYRRKNFLS